MEPLKNRFLKRLLGKRLIFVAGKGGVGKSSVSAALAKLQSSNQKKTAIVDLGLDKTLTRHFNIQSNQSPTQEISENLTLIKLRPNYALELFITEKIHFRMFYKTLLDNKFVNYFLEATPGLSEYLIMGEIWKLLQREENPFDAIIVDAPATGHLLALLEVPKIVAKAIHSGPLKQLAGKILQLITDKDKTSIVVVSLPEEMPVTESEIIAKGAKKLGIETSGLLLNKTTPELKIDAFSIEAPKKYLPTIKASIMRIVTLVNNEKPHIKKLIKKFSGNVVTIPYLDESNEALISDNIVTIIRRDL